MKIAKRRVGKTALFVTEVAFGCSSQGNLGREVSDAEAAEVFAHAWDRGMRYFDTAPHYGRGLSEQRLGAFLADKPRAEYAISTKVGRVLSPGPAIEEADGFVRPLSNQVRYDYSAAGIRESFAQSCARLGVDHIDILFVHDLGEYTHGAENAAHMADFLGSGLAELERMRANGEITGFGLGVNECQVCLDVMKHAHLDAILLAGRLTLLDRQGEEELVAACAAAGTNLILGGIFNSGILAVGPVPGAWFDYEPASQEILDQVAVLKEKSEAVGMSLPQAALRFALDHPATCSILLGTGKISSLDRNLTALGTPISDAARDFLRS